MVLLLLLMLSGIRLHSITLTWQVYEKPLCKNISNSRLWYEVQPLSLAIKWCCLSNFNSKLGTHCTDYILCTKRYLLVTGVKQFWGCYANFYGFCKMWYILPCTQIQQIGWVSEWQLGNIFSSHHNIARIATGQKLKLCICINYWGSY